MSIAPFVHFACMDKWLPAAIARALAERAGPASDYTHPPQEPFRRPPKLADYCIKHGCPIQGDCAGEACYLLQT